MQHLLDFIQEHTLEEQLYFLARCPAEELEVQWRRAEANSCWHVRRQRSEGPWELVPQSELIAYLECRGADMLAIRQELNAMLAAQIAFADMVLRDANRDLGPSLVERFVRSHQGFIAELQAAIEGLSERPRPRMVVVDGGGVQTGSRAGHLSIVR